MTEPTVTLTAREYAIFLQQTTLRDQFAMAALQHDMCNCLNSKDAAEIAYLIADAMLEARKVKK